MNPTSLRGYSNVASNPGYFNDAFYKDVFAYEALHLNLIINLVEPELTGTVGKIDVILNYICMKYSIVVIVRRQGDVGRTDLLANIRRLWRLSCIAC